MEGRDVRMWIETWEGQMGGRRQGVRFRDGVDRDCKRAEFPVFD